MAESSLIQYDMDDYSLGFGNSFYLNRNEYANHLAPRSITPMQQRANMKFAANSGTIIGNDDYQDPLTTRPYRDTQLPFLSNPIYLV